MTQRLDLIQGIKPEMTTWYYEAKDKLYKDFPAYYKDMCEIMPISKCIGGYWKGTSAIGASELSDALSNGQYSEDHPQEGFTVYITLKSKQKKVNATRELQRDWHRGKDFIKEYVQGNWYKAVENTKEKVVANIYNYGGYTAGHDVFNNDDADIGLTTYTSPKLCYDGKPFFALSGNNHTAKDAQTYYNAVALTGVNYANAKTMYNLLTATNNRMENGIPFDNSDDVRIVCHKSLELDWKTINNSTLNPDNGENASNPLAGAFKKIVGNPHITTATQSVMTNGGKGLYLFMGEQPKFNFWIDNDPEKYWASVVFDYAIGVQNFRGFVANNAPTSA